MFRAKENNKIVFLNAFKAHRDVIYTMAARKTKSGIITGSRDG